MNGTRKKSNQQPISIKCPEENLAALIVEAEKRFRTIKGYLQINEVKSRMRSLQKQEAKAI